MPDALAASLLHLLPGLKLGSTGQDAGNRFSLDGVTLGSRQDGALEIAIRRFEAASLQVASGPLMLELGSLALHQLVAVVRVDEGRPRLRSLEAASGEVSGVKVQGPFIFPPQSSAPAAGQAATGDMAAGAWRLGPLAAANGTVRAQITDAHLAFDADVTVPIQQGRIDFNDATVEHVGPDSRMGVSRLGLYVDAPNGRSYLYQFPATPLAGVQFEKRGALLGPWVTDRGHLDLQAFIEAQLGQGPGGAGPGFTAQTRVLLDRTALSGEVRLGDGPVSAPGVQAELSGRAEGRNAVRLQSEAVGRGVSAAMPALSLRKAVLNAGAAQLGCDELTGELTFRLDLDGTQLRFTGQLENVKFSGVRLHPDRSEGR